MADFVKKLQDCEVWLNSISGVRKFSFLKVGDELDMRLEV